MFRDTIDVNSARMHVAIDIEANDRYVAKGTNGKLDYIDITCTFVQFIC